MKQRILFQNNNNVNRLGIMTNKHRWYDVIVAWASGEKIQYSEAGIIGYEDYIPFGENAVPAFNSVNILWRIKPKTVTKKYRMALIKCDVYEGCTCIEVSDSSIDDPIEYNIPGFISWVGDTVEVEIEIESND